MKKIAFIINPISGTGHKEAILAYLKESFADTLKYTTCFYTTKCAGDAYLAAKRFNEENYDIVTAIGGDGTVNQVAKGLINSNTKLAIIPVGSGNGLARHLKIPLSYHKAIETIFDEKTQLIDAGKINDEVFFCTAGLGFEAVIGDRFNSSGSRGLITYVEFCAREYVKYHSENYIIDILGNRYAKRAFLITFANCAQWGNNAYIAPDANISDGMIDMVVWKNAPLVSMPLLTAGLFLKTIQFSEFVDTYRCKDILIIREREGLIQFDGESRTMGKEINVSVLHHAVKVIVPARHYPMHQMKDIV
ncbi:MAG: YegS/Rv2252/BmrU family lipid kinase, partial [Bacteroidales bacterium]